MKIYDLVRQRLFENSILKTIGHRWHQRDKKEALSFLMQRAAEETAKKHGRGVALVVGVNKESALPFLELLKKRGLKVTFQSLEQIQKNKQGVNSIKNLSIIISCMHTERENMQCAEIVRITAPTIPFEYSFIPNENYQELMTYDQPYYSSNYFVSPVLSDDIDVFTIYTESLKHFELKCDIRDYMDLYQNLKNIKKNNISGDIVEFGSYKGHSGYLIAELMKHLKLQKKLYMYDTFSSFPVEKGSLDSFWSKTHEVDFASIKKAFAGRDNVTLVKGDFTKTFKSIHPAKISFAYVDCDSYRATEYILKEVFGKYLSKGGAMTFEDYGHPALLGNRVAIKKYFNSKKGIYSFYSQFSGLYSVVKLQ